MTYLEIFSDPDKCRDDQVSEMKIVMAIEKMKEQKCTHIFSSHIYFVYIYWKNTVSHPLLSARDWFQNPFGCQKLWMLKTLI